MSNLHAIIHGRVQGVGFRWFVREHARRLRIAGWVRNLDGGAVEVTASGPEDALAEFRTLLGRGPSAAHVSSVDESAPERQHEAPPDALRFVTH